MNVSVRWLMFLAERAQITKARKPKHLSLRKFYFESWLDLQVQTTRWNSELSYDLKDYHHWLLFVNECWWNKQPRIRRLNMFTTWVSYLRTTLLLLLISAVVAAVLTLPIEKVRFFLQFHFWVSLISFFL